MPKQYHTAKRCSITQLQASSDGKGTMGFSLDDASRADLDFIIEFCQDALQVNPSQSVIIRRALMVYFCHLGEKIVEASMETHDGHQRDHLKAFQAFIRQERGALYRAAGKEAPDSRSSRKESVH